MRGVTEHQKRLVGKVHLHNSVANRHGPYTCWLFGNDSRSANPISLFAGRFGSALYVYHIINSGAV